jgi:hypothetical protein
MVDNSGVEPDLIAPAMLATDYKTSLDIAHYLEDTFNPTLKEPFTLARYSAGNRTHILRIIKTMSLLGRYTTKAFYCCGASNTTMSTHLHLTH